MPNENAALNPLALEALINNQRQLDIDGVEVGVSRQALDELIAAYTAISPSDAERHERAVPDGWQLVPKIPTDEMSYQGAEAFFSPQAKTIDDENERAASVYRRMLSASPPAAVQEPVAVKADERIVRDAIRSAYDCGYNDARMELVTERGPALGYRGRDKSEEIGSALLRLLSTSQSDPAPEIAALTTENERLRKILSDIAKNGRLPPGRARSKWITIPSGLFSRARAAVAPEQEEAK